MALRIALGTVIRTQQCRVARRALCCRPRQGAAGCTLKAPPQAPPRAPPARPPCRAPPADRERRTPVVCRPPPSGHAPPCDPPRCPPSLDCMSSVSKVEPVRKVRVGSAEPCGASMDSVERRLRRARRARRDNYEREAAAGGSRCAQARPGAKPGPGPEPPRPADVGCRPRRAATLEPCAHMPQKVVEVHRDGPALSSAKTLTTRIMESLSLKRAPAAPRAPRALRPRPGAPRGRRPPGLRLARAVTRRQKIDI